MKTGQQHARTPAGDKMATATATGPTRDKVRKPLTNINIPALYRGPVGDRDLQGCMKARA